MAFLMMAHLMKRAKCGVLAEISGDETKEEEQKSSQERSFGKLHRCLSGSPFEIKLFSPFP